MQLNELKDKLRSKMGVDALIVGAAILTLIVALIFFFEDGLIFGSKNQNGDKAQVGRLINSRNDVRRRLDAGLTWGAVASSDKVYEGDNIFTGDDSEAKVEFDQGGDLNIDAKSLVVIHTKGGKLEIDLQYGSLQGHLQAGTPLTLLQNGERKQIIAKDAEIRIIRAEKTRKTTIQVLKGELTVQNKTVRKNEIVEVASEQAPVVSKLTLTALPRPAGSKPIWLAPDKPLDLSWKTDKPQDSYQVEISKDDSFVKPLFVTTAKGTKYSLFPPARPAGVFHWRVKAKSGGTPSLPQTVTVYEDLAPTLLAPADGFKFTASEEPKAEPGGESKEKTKEPVATAISFTWDDQAGSTEFQIDISKDAEFKNAQMIISNEKTKVSSFVGPALNEGSYYWRVRGMHPDRLKSPISRTFSFVVLAAPKPLEVPKLAATDLHYSITEKMLKRMPASIPASGRGIKPQGLLPISWKPVDRAVGYDVEVSDTPDFKFLAPSETSHVSAPSFVPSEVRPGSLFYRVRARDAKGAVSEPSEIAKLQVKIAPPQLAPIKEQKLTFDSRQALETDSSKYKFDLSWKAEPFAEGYDIEWGADPEFKRFKTFKTLDPARTIAVNRPQDYPVRVRATDATGAPISDFSNVQIAHLEKSVQPPKEVPLPPAPPLPASIDQANADSTKASGKDKAAGLAMPMIHTAVVLREPLPDTALISLESSPTFVNFKWSAVKGATNYILELAKDADFSDKIAEFKVKKTSFVYQKPLPEGHIFWRVRFTKASDFSEWSEVSDLTVIYQ